MAAFERTPSGTTGLDRVLDHIRIGDNVVWQVSEVSDYARLARRFGERAIADGRKLIYVRFAPHEPVFEPRAGLDIVTLDPSGGFERFTVEVHRVVEEAGKEAFYIFDCLSVLQEAWSADLMMGNFFMVTCPYLFELDTVAWFCILRHRHSYEAIVRIRETTQILIDLWHGDRCVYLHPIKVWKRYSDTMFFPHCLSAEAPDEARPLTDGVSVSRFYEIAGRETDSGETRNLDSWELFFMDARKAVSEGGLSGIGGAGEALARKIAERIVGSEERMLALVTRNCSVQDLLAVKDRMIGSGKIGGKAAGMVVARQILRKRLPDLERRIEPHDSFYVGTDVFYAYVVHNKLWKLRVRQRGEDGYYALAPALREGILEGSFPDDIRGRFVRMLEYFGQAPIIARSSSLLEDSFGHAFAGKYESVFCVNSGSPEDRLAALEDAVRRVYASAMDPSALAYREKRGLRDRDEQMAILVQRVSGSLYGSLFMPAVAGVGYSRNAWRWHPDLDPRAGMVRLVIGLGTRAVDRTASDYPRLASLDRPDLGPDGPAADPAEHCQRSVDCLDLGARAFATRPLEDVSPQFPDWLTDLLVERDAKAESASAERGQNRAIRIGTCSGVLAERALLGDLSATLRALEDEYGSPVDVEFTVNWAAPGDWRVNLLQCRPLQTLAPAQGTSGDTENAHASDVLGATNAHAAPGDIRSLARLDDAALRSVPEDRFLFRILGHAMGPELSAKVDTVVLIDPARYYELPYRDKPTVARAVGELNARYRGRDLTVILIAPGRIGTTSPELGVPVSFSEIDGFAVLCELAWSKAGYNPELSFGSHFFQDLVETGIYYAAIPEPGEERELSSGDARAIRHLWRPELLEATPDRAREFLPDFPFPKGLITVRENPGLAFRSDVVRGICLCGKSD
jgi:hypothetical protein